MITAFKQLYTDLKPDLQHTMWPPPSWPVDHKMPSEAPVDQYLVLAQHIRDAWRLVRPGHEWSQQASCQVAAILKLPPRLQAVGRMHISSSAEHNLPHGLWQHVGV